MPNKPTLSSAPFSKNDNSQSEQGLKQLLPNQVVFSPNFRFLRFLALSVCGDFTNALET
jgi:hypothetical protein